MIRWSEENVIPVTQHIAGSTQQLQTKHHRTPAILLVEDDQTLATLEAHILSLQGLKVTTVNSGELALVEIKKNIPDLVILDFELAGKINGSDVLRNVRIYTTVPVLLTTSSKEKVRTAIRTYRESKETLDHLPKPYLMQTFLRRVKRMLLITP